MHNQRRLAKKFQILRKILLLDLMNSTERVRGQQQQLQSQGKHKYNQCIQTCFLYCF